MRTEFRLVCFPFSFATPRNRSLELKLASQIRKHEPESAKRRDGDRREGRKEGVGRYKGLRKGFIVVDEEGRAKVVGKLQLGKGGTRGS